MKIIHNITRLLQRRKELRNNSTPQEIALWLRLKDSQLGYKFRRQHSVGGYIVDFYCPAKRLVIEIDGSSHFSKDGREYDKTRDEYLKSASIRVVRFSNNEIDKDIEKVVQKIILLLE